MDTAAAGFAGKQLITGILKIQLPTNVQGRTDSVAAPVFQVIRAGGSKEELALMIRPPKFYFQVVVSNPESPPLHFRTILWDTGWVRSLVIERRGV